MAISVYSDDDSDIYDSRGGKLLMLLLIASLFSSQGLIVSGELFRFLVFCEKYPFVLVNMMLFSLTSAIGQVRMKTHKNLPDDMSEKLKCKRSKKVKPVTLNKRHWSGENEKHAV